jgi:hypothetical protein
LECGGLPPLLRRKQFRKSIFLKNDVAAGTSLAAFLLRL